MTKMVHFPPTMGLAPRPLDGYDRICMRYYTAKWSSATRIECELTLSRVYGVEWDELDFAYSHGRNMCERYEVR